MVPCLDAGKRFEMKRTWVLFSGFRASKSNLREAERFWWVGLGCQREDEVRGKIKELLP